MALGWRSQYNRYKDYFLNVASFYKQRADVRAFLEIILSLSTVVIFLLFALRPTVLTIISLLKEIEVKKETIAALDKKIRDLDTASEVFAENESSIPAIEMAIPTKPLPDLLLRQVELLATKNAVILSGATVSEITLVGSTPTKKTSSDLKPLPSGAKEMTISITVSGNYQSIIGFIKDLENLRIVIKIDTVLTTSSTKDAGQVIVAVITGRVPYED